VLSESTLERGPEWRNALLRRIAMWVVFSTVVLLLLTGVALEVLLHNAGFHNYLLGKIEKDASESLGTEVSLRDFTLHLSNLSVDLYNLRIDGAAPYANPPLLVVDHAEVGVRILSLLQRKWYVDSIRIDRPIVRIYVDAKGVSNIPVIKSNGKSSSNTNLFDLAIRHAVLDRGEVYYNDRRSVLSADVHEVDFHAAF
jgi:uncharacterized protein involved in outer membrane biogenesis